MANQICVSPVHIIDGIPLPLARNARARRAKMLREHAAWGFCAAKDERFWGLRGHMVLADNGFIEAFLTTPANIDEREVLSEIASMINGLLIGDKGYISQKWRDEMARSGIDLQTPLRMNMQDDRPKEEVKALIRKRIETAFSILDTERLPADAGRISAMIFEVLKYDIFSNGTIRC